MNYELINNYDLYKTQFYIIYLFYSWRFGCTNIHNLLEINIPDAKSNIFTIIGFGFNSPSDDMEQGLYIDHISFLSEKRQIISDKVSC